MQLEARSDEDDSFLDEDARLSARMDQGLYSLQQCALIVGHLWFVGDMGVRKRILQLLHQKACSLEHPSHDCLMHRFTPGNDTCVCVVSFHLMDSH